MCIHPVTTEKASVKKHLAVIKGFLKEGCSSGVACFDGLRPSHKTLEWTLGSTKLADLTNGLEVASLQQHANEDVGIGMPAALRRAKEPNRITFLA